MVRNRALSLSRPNKKVKQEVKKKQGLEFKCNQGFKIDFDVLTLDFQELYIDECQQLRAHADCDYECEKFADRLCFDQKMCGEAYN